MASYRIFPDRPLEDAQCDLLWQDNTSLEAAIGTFAQHVALSTHDSLQPNDALTMAIHAPWGCGKSSMLSIIGARILEVSKLTFGASKILVGWVEVPHRNPSGAPERDEGAEAYRLVSTAVLRTLLPVDLESAITALNRIDPSLGMHLLERASVAETQGTLEASVVQRLAANCILDAGLTDEAVQQLTSTAGHEGRCATVIMVDDVDRCSPSTAYQVLRATQKFNRVRGIFFCIAADRGALLEAVRTGYPDLGSPSYALEKYIHHSIDLPRISGSQITEMLLFLVKEWPELLELFTSGRELLTRAFSGSTPRAAKLWLNASLSELSIAGGGAVRGTDSAAIVDQLLQLKRLLIKYHLPGIYSAILGADRDEGSGELNRMRGVLQSIEIVCSDYAADGDLERLRFELNRIASRTPELSPIFEKIDGRAAMLLGTRPHHHKPTNSGVRREATGFAEGSTGDPQLPLEVGHSDDEPGNRARVELSPSDFSEFFNHGRVASLDDLKYELRRKYNSLQTALQTIGSSVEQDQVAVETARATAIDIWNYYEANRDAFETDRAFLAAILGDVGGTIGRLEPGAGIRFLETAIRYRGTDRTFRNNTYKLTELVVTSKRGDLADQSAQLLNELDGILNDPAETQAIASLRLSLAGEFGAETLGQDSQLTDALDSMEDHLRNAQVAITASATNWKMVYSNLASMLGTHDPKRLDQISQDVYQRAEPGEAKYQLLRYLADALAAGSDSASKRALDIYRYIIEEDREEFRGADIDSFAVRFNMAVLLYSLDFDEEAGELLFELYQHRRSRDIRELYGQYLNRARRPDLGSRAFDGHDIEEKVLLPSEQYLPPRFSLPSECWWERE